ncbi:PQQ-binding-like beta-propeller repeat protein, partial [Candidatus Latescibacterota bacterium]
EGGVYALRLDNGKEIWHREVEQGQIHGRVVTDGNMVYYGAGRMVYACDAKTGKPLWQTPLNGTIVAGLTAGNGKLFIPAGEHKLYCLDASRGKILWDYTVALPIMMEPATEGNRVFFGAMDGYFRALDTETGKEVWKNQWSSMEDKYITAPFWPPVIAGDKVIVGKNLVQKEDKNLVAFTASTGKISWSSHVTAGTMRLVLNPEKDKLYTYYNQNRQRGLQCFSAKDGSVLWNQATGVVMNAGSTSRGMVLVRDAYNICCVDAITGKVQWTYHTSTGPQGSYYGPGASAVKENQVIVGTMDGHVIALKW